MAHMVDYDVYQKTSKAKGTAEFKLRLIAAVTTADLDAVQMLTIAEILGMLPPPKEAA